MDYMQVADLSYLESFQSFFTHRMNYYSDVSAVINRSMYKRIFNKFLYQDIKLNFRRDAIDSISQTKARIIITTATKNRRNKIISAYYKLLVQKGSVDWHWLIIDNGSDDGTIDEVSSWNDNRVSIVLYPEITGCAFPVRNFAFDIVSAGLKNNPNSNSRWILNIDSDDQLFNEYSLLEVYKLMKKATSVKGGVSLAHGYAVWETHDEKGKLIISSCPVNIDGRFPEVKKMYEIFERGLIVLAAIIPAEDLYWLRYPAEFSFEDDAVNQKIMLQSMKRNKPWVYTDYPIILKGSGEDTMINRNNNLGNPEKEAVIGIGHRVTGVRADIVNNLRLLRDYYIRVNL